MLRRRRTPSTAWLRSFDANDSPKPSSENCARRIEVQYLLAQRFPNALPYQSWTAVVQESLAKHLMHDGQFQQARSLLDASIETLSRLLAENPQDRYAEKLLARSHRSLANSLTEADADEIATQRDASANQ